MLTPADKKLKAMQTYHLYLNEQIQGPYSKPEIETRIRDGSVDSITQIAVDGGDWVRIADVFPSLFSQENTNSVGSVATESNSSNPYSPPVADPPLSNSAKVVKYKGIGRLDFAGSAFVILLVGSFISDPTPIAGIVAGLFIMIPASERFKNIGRNPAWCLLLLVPLIGLFITVPCLVLPAGYQQHRKLDLAAKIVGGIIFILLFLGFSSIIASL